MSTAAVRGVVRQLGLADADPPSDAALLTRYARQADPAAFAELLRRHGPAVLGVCRRVLGDPHAADDAFQATFLVLAVKAGAVCPPGSVGGWLYGVAVNVARKAKLAAARRWRREMVAAARDLASRGCEPPESADRADLRAVPRAPGSAPSADPDPVIRAPMPPTDVLRNPAADSKAEAGEWQQFKSLTDHEDFVDGVAFSPDGKTFATGGGGAVIIWD